MIRKILTTYATLLEEYLSRFHNRPEGLATVGQIGNNLEEKPDKMVIGLLNVEKETAGSISAPMRQTENGYVRMRPPLLLNLNVMIAAVFDGLLYAESLSMLSDTLRFMQSEPEFEVDGTFYTIEIVNLSLQDQNNMWTLLGGQYYPSVVCKIRRLCIDGEQITAGGTNVGRPVVKM